MVEVARRQAEPPATQRWQAHGYGDVAQPRAVILEEFEPHPFAGGNEIEATISIEIDPNRIRDHTVRVRELRAHLLRDVGEVPAVVPQQIAPRRIGIIPGRYTAADKKIGAAIAVEVADRDRRGAGEHRRQRRAVSDETSVPLIDVQPIL